MADVLGRSKAPHLDSTRNSFFTPLTGVANQFKDGECFERKSQICMSSPRRDREGLMEMYCQITVSSD